jgi:hypothetical protein
MVGSDVYGPARRDLTASGEHGEHVPGIFLALSVSGVSCYSCSSRLGVAGFTLLGFI